MNIDLSPAELKLLYVALMELRQARCDPAFQTGQVVIEKIVAALRPPAPAKQPPEAPAD